MDILVIGKDHHSIVPLATAERYWDLTNKNINTLDSGGEIQVDFIEREGQKKKIVCSLTLIKANR